MPLIALLSDAKGMTLLEPSPSKLTETTRNLMKLLVGMITLTELSSGHRQKPIVQRSEDEPDAVALRQQCVRFSD